MEVETTLTEMPKKFKKAANLVYLSLLVGFIESVLYETMTDQKILSDPKAFGIITFLIIGFLGFKIGQGKNWARITLLVVFIIPMIGYPFLVFGEFLMSPVIGIVSIAQMLILLYALILLFSREAQEWYKEQKVKTEPVNRSVLSEWSKKNWIWLLIPLSIFGYLLGCDLNTGGNAFAGFLMIAGPFIFMFG